MTWRCTVSLAALLGSISLIAQELDDIPLDLIEQRIELIAGDLGDDSDIDLTALFDELLGYYRAPFDLNHGDLMALASLQLLSDVQINALTEHLRDHGKLISIYELQAVRGFDLGTIRLILPFVTVREDEMRSHASIKEMLKNGEHEVIVRSITSIQERRGSQDRENAFGRDYYDPDGDALPDFDNAQVIDSLRTNNKVYLGSPYKLYARYRFKYRNDLSFGITAEKDEGEEFFQGSQKNGFDFYSAHLFMRDVGPLRAVALGDYLAQFGQGLTFWSGLAFSAKSSYTMNIKRNARGLSPYASVNENLFLRGAGATYGWGDLEFTAFYSKKDLDGNVSDQVADSLASDIEPEVIFTSFQEDGLHRTFNELKKKDAIEEQIIGGNLNFSKPGFSIGATAARAAYGATLTRNTQPYNQFEFQGKENTTMGADASVVYRNLNLFGEVARSANGGIAYMTGLLVAPDPHVSISMLFRDYARDFHGLYSAGFGEGSSPWNERGLYTGLEIRPSREWLFNAYYDQFRFPWLRYLVDAPSEGFEWFTQLTHKPSRRIELYVRVRRQDKARNTEVDVDDIDPLVRTVQTNYRFNATYSVSKAVSLRTRMEAVDFQRGGTPLEHGFLIYQDVVHRPLSSPWEFTFRVALFDTDSYDARVYAYENDIVGLFSILPYYGRGMRWYTMVRYSPVRRMDIWVRYGSWIYNDRDVYSSGLQEIAGNVRSDLKMQLRWKF